MDQDWRQLRGFQDGLPPAASQIVSINRRAVFTTEDPARELSLRPFNLALEIDLLQTNAEWRRHHELIEPAILREDFPALK
jgi:hypothetical protein